MQPKSGSMSSNVSTVRDTLERHMFVEIYCCKIHRRKNRETHTWIHSKMNTNPSLANASKPVARPLSSMIHGKNLGAHDGAAWTDGDNKASADFKKKKKPFREYSYVSSAKIWFTIHSVFLPKLLSCLLWHNHMVANKDWSCYSQPPSVTTSCGCIMWHVRTWQTSRRTDELFLTLQPCS